MIEFKNAPVLSKLKVGEVAYYLKDAEARTKLNEEISKLKSAAYSEASNVVGKDEKLVSGSAVMDYVTKALGDTTKAVIFRGISTTDPAGGTVTIEGEVIVAKAGDFVLYGTKEFIYDGKNWVELGDEGIYLTKAEAANTYVAKTFTIAGIDLQDNITAEEIKTALGLQNLAYKSEASTTVNDYVNGITGADYTPTGDINVALTQTSTEITSTGNVKATGNITGSVTAKGNINLSRADGEGGFQVTGTVAAPTVTVTPNTSNVISRVATEGSLPTKEADKYVAPTFVPKTATFATAGLVAEMDGSDTEMLVFSAAGTNTAIASAEFNGGSFTEGAFNQGAMPTFESTSVVTGIQSVEATAPAFTGDKIQAGFTGTSSEITANFEGDSVAVSVSGNYDKATIDAEKTNFTGAKTTITPTLTKTNKTITVQ